jgi:parallel beta-helix repeat protein
MVTRRHFLRLAVGAGSSFAAYALVGCSDPLAAPLPDPGDRPADGRAHLNVRDFGAVGDGRTDDTAALQAAIAAAPADGAVVFVPAGVYLVDALKSVLLRDNLVLELANAATLRAMPNASKWYAILLARGSRNLAVRGGTLQGERNEHLGTGGEWGMGLHLLGCEDVLVEGVTARDCWGDGFYVGHSTRASIAGGECARVTLRGCVALNNRRQGLSITGCIDARIEDCIFAQTNGTAPQSGIDLEPNGIKRVEKVTIIDCRCTDNAGWGILLVNAGVQYNSILGNRCEGNGFDGIRVTRQASRNTISGNTVQANGQHGIRLDDHVSESLVRRNVCLANSWVSPAAYDNIIIQDRAERNRLMENRSRAQLSGSSGGARYGLRIDGPDCVATELAGNDLQWGGLIGALSDEGTGTIITR